MQHLGYYECLVQHRIYVKGLNQGNIRIICVRVDNLLVTESNLVEIEDLKLHMYNEFDMVDFDGLRYFLCFEYDKTRKGTTFNKNNCITNILNKFNILSKNSI